MSDASDALEDGMADCVSQHSVTVTIDGGGTFLAVPDQMQRGNSPSEYGVREVAGVQLSFLRTAWTPVVGKRLTLGGIAFVVASVDYTSPAAYVATCVEGNIA